MRRVTLGYPSIAHPGRLTRRSSERGTFKRDFAVVGGGTGQTFNAGSTFDLDGTLKKSGDRWLIEGI